MSDIAVQAVNLSKSYRITHAQTGRKYRTLQDEIMGLVRRPFRRGSRLEQTETIWALKDVSFEVKKGEAIGIIGRNGAGKSTLLKILSRITQPTSGYADVFGRVGSLLEVGTGFHSELTGRENIYLSGAVLGMTRREIQRRFDEIVAFAEIEKFLDTPVKRYSSGMYMRLAFAVAAHLEPEILVVDEVLAVGDAQFQKKCLGKMEEVADEGRTVLFVSHNMAAIQNLCQRAIFLSSGKIALEGSTNAAISAYISTTHNDSKIPLTDRRDRQGTGELRFTAFYALNASGELLADLVTGECVTLVAEYESRSLSPLRHVTVSIPFYDQQGQHLFMAWSRMTGQDFDEISPAGQFRVHIDKFPLLPGTYAINLFCEISQQISDWIQNAATVTVIDGDFYGTGYLTPDSRSGVAIEHTWEYIPFAVTAALKES